MSLPSRFSPLVGPSSSKLRGGFTLVELLVVIAVILVLVGLTFGISTGVRDAQARAKAKAELAMMAQALEQFKSRHGDYPWAAANPGTAEGNSERLLQALAGYYKFDASADPIEFVEKTAGEIPPSGPKGYVDLTKLSLNRSVKELPDAPSDVPTGFHFADPWGNPYVYRYKADASTTWDKLGYVLFSRGPDGMTGPAIPESGIKPSKEGQALDNIYAGEL